MSEADEDVYVLDPACPICGEPHYVGEVFDGSERHCANCGTRLVAVAYQGGTMQMNAIERAPADSRSGRQRTRTLWRKRGRR